MKLNSEDEIKAYKALTKFGNEPKAILALTKEGIELTKAKNILNRLETRIKKENRKSSIPKIYKGFLFMICILVGFQFVVGPIANLLLLPLGLAIVRTTQGIFHYLVPSIHILDDA